MNCKAFHSHTLPSCPEKFFLNHRSNIVFDQQAFRLIREQIPENICWEPTFTLSRCREEEQQQH